MQRWVIASNNRGKVDEFNVLLNAYGVSVVPQRDLGIDSIPETAQTFVENALLKARHAARCSGLPALADDSGLVVPALHGEPGLHSARYAEDAQNPAQSADARNIAKLLHRCSPLHGDARQAFFICLLVLLRHPDDPAPTLCEGRWHGRIANCPAGSHGFGYDPIFIPNDHTLAKQEMVVLASGNEAAATDHDRSAPITAAQLDKATKNRLSHRGKALRQLMSSLGIPLP